MLNEKSDWGTPILNWLNLLNWIGRIYFIWTIWWNPQHKVNYLSLLLEAKHYQLLQAPVVYEFTRTFLKNKFSFCPWKWIRVEPDNFWYRPRNMINLFNFGIKTVVHIVIIYDNSQIKMKKKLPKTSTVCENIIIYKIEIRK